MQENLFESQEACVASTEVLRADYEGASLLQVSFKARAKDQDVAAVGGSGILGMLEVTASDFGAGLEEAHTLEKQSQSDYDKMM